MGIDPVKAVRRNGQRTNPQSRPSKSHRSITVFGNPAVSLRRHRIFSSPAAALRSDQASSKKRNREQASSVRASRAAGRTLFGDMVMELVRSVYRLGDESPSKLAERGRQPGEFDSPGA